MIQYFEEKKYAPPKLAALDFSIKKSDVRNLTEKKILELSKAKIHNENIFDFLKIIVLKNKIRQKIGKYEVILGLWDNVEVIDFVTIEVTIKHKFFYFQKEKN